MGQNYRKSVTACGLHSILIPKPLHADQDLRCSPTARRRETLRRSTPRPLVDRRCVGSVRFTPRHAYSHPPRITSSGTPVATLVAGKSHDLGRVGYFSTSFAGTPLAVAPLP